MSGWKKAGGRLVRSFAGGGKAFISECEAAEARDGICVDVAVHIPAGDSTFRFDSHSFEGKGGVKQAKAWAEIRIGQST